MSTLTVILPVYNAEKYLAETLDCIQNQSFTDFRVLTDRLILLSKFLKSVPNLTLAFKSSLEKIGASSQL